MSKVCDLTGKKAIVGHKVSFSNKKSLRRFHVNLHTKKFWIPEEKQWITLKVSTSALRTISKKGINAVINDVVKKGSI
jgi:large subunit ribosomal protein L28